MKLGALLLLGALALNAQPPFEIRGTVVEPGLGGIAGAEVRAQGPGNTVPPRFVSAFTDARGEFVIRTSAPGAYILQPTRDGYLPSIRSEAGIRSVVVDASRPSGSVQLLMVRPAEIVGRVLDAETREPMADVDVFILQKAGNGSGWNQTISLTLASAPENASAKTDGRGNFAAKGLLPGEYVASTIRQEGTTWRAEYSPDDLKVIDQTPEMLFWPGGTAPEVARPIPVGSGAVVSFGDILLKKVPHYRAHVSLQQGSCPPGESMRVSVSGQPLSNLQPSAFPCGSELLLRGLMPGTYHLYAVSDWQGFRDSIETAAWATADFVVEDKNVEVPLTPHAGVVLEGQVTASDGVTLPDAFTLGVRPLPIADGFQPGPEQFVDPLDGGKFRMAVGPLPQSFLGARYRDAYIQQIRYNGTPLRGLTLEVNPGSVAQRLEIMLDNKFGALTGTISGGDSSTRLYINAWSEGADRPDIAPVNSGRFEFSKLVPGEYLLSAGSAQLGDASRRPSEQDAKRVTVRPGETTTINVSAPPASR